MELIIILPVILRFVPGGRTLQSYPFPSNLLIISVSVDAFVPLQKKKKIIQYSIF